jgi:hypothetical protein
MHVERALFVGLLLIPSHKHLPAVFISIERPKFRKSGLQSFKTCGNPMGQEADSNTSCVCPLECGVLPASWTTLPAVTFKLAAVLSAPVWSGAHVFCVTLVAATPLSVPLVIFAAVLVNTLPMKSRSPPSANATMFPLSPLSGIANSLLFLKTATFAAAGKESVNEPPPDGHAERSHVDSIRLGRAKAGVAADRERCQESQCDRCRPPSSWSYAAGLSERWLLLR